MDPSTLFVGLGLCTAVGTALLAIMKLGFREQEFEDALRKQQHEPSKAAKKAKDQGKKGKIKAGKIIRTLPEAHQDHRGKNCLQESSDSVVAAATERDCHHLHIEYDPDPVIIETNMPSTLTNKNSLGSAVNIKSILRNRSDSKSEVTVHDESIEIKDQSNSMSTEGVFPKDEVELKHHHELKKKNVGIKAPLEMVAPIAISSSQLKSSTSTLSKGKMSGKGTKHTDAPVQKPLVQDATPTNSNMQLTDATLPFKEEANESWTTKFPKGDSVILQKQLKEKEQELYEQKQLAVASAAKVTQLHQQLLEEQARTQTEQLAHERISRLQQDNAALHTRMQQTHEMHSREVAVLKQQCVDPLVVQQQASEIGQLSEENQKLKQALPSPAEIKALKDQAQMLQLELSKSIHNLMMTDGSKSMLEQKYRRLEEQLVSKQEVETTLNKRLEKISQELQRSEQASHDLRIQLEAELALRSLTENNASKARQDAEVAKQQAALALAELREQAKQKELKAAADLASLNSQLEESTQALKLATEQCRFYSDAAGLHADQVAMEAQTLADLARLQREVQSRDFEVDSLRADLELQRQTSNAFRMKYERAEKVNHEFVEAAHAKCPARVVLKQLDGRDAEAYALREELISKTIDSTNVEMLPRINCNDGMAGVCADQKSTMLLPSLQQDLELQRKKNNELREKNWKLAEALNEAEKRFKRGNDSATAASSTSAFCQAKALLLKLFPTPVIDDTLGADDWLASFEKLVTVREGETSAMQQQQPL